MIILRNNREIFLSSYKEKKYGAGNEKKCLKNMADLGKNHFLPFSENWDHFLKISLCYCAEHIISFKIRYYTPGYVM